jgi:hypothetical protein
MRNSTQDMPKDPEANETLVSMFLSGRKSQQAGEGLDGKVDLDVYEENYKEVEFFPDPPCIAPFEDEEEATGQGKKMSGTTPQEYWKGHANWQEEDPAMEEPRQAFAEFSKFYQAKLGMNQQKSEGEGQDAGKDTRTLKQTKSKAFRRIATGTASSGDLGVIEAFVNISVSPVGIRKTSSLSDNEKTGEVVKPGECVVVDKVSEDAHIRFLKLADGRGWVFDRNQDTQVMAKMDEVEMVCSWYKVMCKEIVDVRRAPIYDESAKTGRLLSPQELAVVNLKCRVRGHVFVHLADGRGWVFLVKPGSDKKKRSYADTVMEECDGEIIQDQSWLDQADILPATNECVEVGLWTYVVGDDPVLALGSKLHGTYLNPGDVLKIDKRAYAAGDPPVDGLEPQRWLRLMDGRGWLPEKGTNNKNIVALQGSMVSYPSHFRGKEKVSDIPKAQWMVGVA